MIRRLALAVAILAVGGAGVAVAWPGADGGSPAPPGQHFATVWFIEQPTTAHVAGHLWGPLNTEADAENLAGRLGLTSLPIVSKVLPVP